MYVLCCTDENLFTVYAAPDAEWFASLGLNMQRLAINYRHLNDDLDPEVMKESGFKLIDRVVEIVSDHPKRSWLRLCRTPQQGFTPSSISTPRPVDRTLIGTATTICRARCCGSSRSSRIGRSGSGWLSLRGTRGERDSLIRRVLA